MKRHWDQRSENAALTATLLKKSYPIKAAFVAASMFLISSCEQSTKENQDSSVPSAPVMREQGFRTDSGNCGAVTSSLAITENRDEECESREMLATTVPHLMASQSCKRRLFGIGPCRDAASGCDPSCN